jgi:hypothetical protein
MVEEIDVTPVSECVTKKSQRRAWHSRSPMVFSSNELMQESVGGLVFSGHRWVL